MHFYSKFNLNSFLMILIINCLFFFSGETSEQAIKEWNGEEYHQHSTEQRYAACRLIEQLHLEGHEQILDVGCGDGHNTFLLAKRVPLGSVWGIDNSPSMIEFASSQFKRDNLHFILMDGTQVHFDHPFDVVVSFTVFHWIEDAKRALKGIYQSLKEDGRMILEMPCKVKDPVHPIHQAAHEVMAQPEWKDHFVGFDPHWFFRTEEEYQALLQETHFTSIHIETYLIRNTFPSKEAFFHAVKQWFPYLKPLPEHLKSHFLETVIERYLELVPLRNQEVPFDVHRILIEAQKG